MAEEILWEIEKIAEIGINTILIAGLDLPKMICKNICRTRK